MFITKKRENMGYTEACLPNSKPQFLFVITNHSTQRITKTFDFLRYFLKNYLSIFSKQVKYLLISRITL